VVQLAVVLRAAGVRYRGVVLGEELLVEPAGQDSQDLDRVVRVVFMHRLCSHASILPQRADSVAEDGQRVSQP